MAVILEGILGGASLFIRLFALIALLVGLSYVSRGVWTLIAIPSGGYSFFVLLTQLARIFFDLLFGVASILIGAGLFFRKEWARNAWLVFLILTLLVELHMTVIQFFAGYSGLAQVYRGIGMLVSLSAISWLYLTKAPIKARFR